MRTTLRLASTAIAAALLLATSGVAVADEPATTSQEPATSGSSEVTGCGDATAGATAAGRAVPDEGSGQAVPDERSARALPDEESDQPADDPCGESAEDRADQSPTEPTAEPTEPAAEPTTEPTDEPADQATGAPTPEPTDVQDEATHAAEPTGEQGEPVAEPTDEPSGDPVAAPADELTTDPGHGQVVGQADPAVDRARELPAAPDPAPAPAPDPAPTPDPAPAPDPVPPAPPTSGPPSRPIGSAPATRALYAATLTPLAVLTTMPAGPSPLTVPFASVDAFPAYDPQVFCDPTPKPGTEYLARLAISYFGAGRLSGISRDCSTGPTSEHKEGRAFDWALSVDVPREKAAGDAFVQWLTAVGPDGKVGYNARRLGVMYLIWNEQIWLNSGTNASWHVYRGPSPHTDHVHVSLTWAGAYERTSWWTGDPIPDRAELARLAGQAWARVFGHEPDAALLTAWIGRLADRGPLPVTGADLSRLAIVFAVVLDAGRWGLDHSAPEPGDNEWATTVGRSVI